MARMALIVRLYSSVWFAWTMVESTCIIIKCVLELVIQGSCIKTLGYLSQVCWYENLSHGYMVCIWSYEANSG
jgi:hypothetical protein